MTRKKVRPPILPITEEDAREEIAKPLRKLCQAHGPTKVGTAIGGVNEKTIRNARDEKSTLRIDNAANLLLLDPLAFEPLLARFHRRTVPIDAICNTDDCTLPLVALLHEFIEMERPDSDGGPAKSRRELKKVEPLLRQVNELTGALLAILAEPPSVKAVA